MTDNEKLFYRVSNLSDDRKVDLLFRLWGFLESNTPRFIEGIEILLPALEKLGKKVDKND